MKKNILYILYIYIYIQKIPKELEDTQAVQVKSWNNESHASARSALQIVLYLCVCVCVFVRVFCLFVGLIGKNIYTGFCF